MFGWGKNICPLQRWPALITAGETNANLFGFANLTPNHFRNLFKKILKKKNGKKLFPCRTGIRDTQTKKRCNDALDPPAEHPRGPVAPQGQPQVAGPALGDGGLQLLQRHAAVVGVDGGGRGGPRPRPDWAEGGGCGRWFAPPFGPTGGHSPVSACWPSAEDHFGAVQSKKKNLFPPTFSRLFSRKICGGGKDRASLYPMSGFCLRTGGVHWQHFARH